MTLYLLGNATGQSNVGRFDYISVYPSWTPPTNGTNNAFVGTNGTDKFRMVPWSSDWADALANAQNIQAAVNFVATNGGGGGTVFITNGIYYVAEPSPNESNNV